MRTFATLAAATLLLGFIATAGRASAQCRAPGGTHLFFVTDRAALGDDQPSAANEA